MITFKTGNDLELDSVIELYRASTLGERRPIDDRERMGAMLNNANLVITAWDGKLLVDFAGIVGFLLHHLPVRSGGSRFAPTKRHRQGVDSPHPIRRRTQNDVAVARRAGGRELLPHVGFTHHPQAWLLPAGETVGRKK